MSNSRFFKLPDGQVAAAVVPLVSPDTSGQVRIIGRCSDLDNVIRDTWDGPTPIYVFPAAPMQMQVVSASANDAAAGTGIRSVLITYLDADYDVHQETVTLNGTTPVNTVATNILRVNGVRAVSVGSGGMAAGNISLQAVGGATTYSIIPAGRNLARQAIYTVPDGYKFQLEQWQVSSGTTTGSHFTTHTLVASCEDGALTNGLFLPKDEQGTQNGGIAVNYPFVSEYFPARTDIKVGIVADSANANAIALTVIYGQLIPV